MVNYNEIQSLSINGRKYKSFIDRHAREQLQDAGTGGSVFVDVDLTQLAMDFKSTDVQRFTGLEEILDPGKLVDVVRDGGILRAQFLDGQIPVTVPLGNTAISETQIKCSGTLAKCDTGLSQDTQIAACGVFTLCIEILDNGYDVYLDCCPAPEGGFGGGLTAEQAAQIQANTDAIANLPVSVKDGYTDITGLRQATAISVVRDGQTITVTSTMQGDVTHTDVITLDENDHPVSIVANGVGCTVDWLGFGV